MRIATVVIGSCVGLLLVGSTAWSSARPKRSVPLLARLAEPRAVDARPFTRTAPPKLAPSAIIDAAEAVNGKPLATIPTVATFGFASELPDGFELHIENGHIHRLGKTIFAELNRDHTPANGVVTLRFPAVAGTTYTFVCAIDGEKGPNVDITVTEHKKGGQSFVVAETHVESDPVAFAFLAKKTTYVSVDLTSKSQDFRFAECQMAG